MRTPSVSVIAPLLALLLTAASTPTGLAAPGVGSGPAVGLDFDVVAFHPMAGDEAIYVAWRNPVSDVASGVLHLDDEKFISFPTLPSGYLTNLRVGAGGPVASRRAYVTWVGSQLDLVLAAFDAGGVLLGPAHQVSNSIQISPNPLASIETGVLVGHSWDDDPFWDPRVLEVDVTGNAVGLEVVETVGPPEQTLGTTVAAEPGGGYAVIYTTTDSREIRVRRYGAGGPLDPTPVTISSDVTSDYVPFSAIFLAATVPSTVLAAFPYQPGSSPDVRFVLVPMSAGPVTPGATMSELVPGFLGSITDMAALPDIDPHAVVVWQEIEREDPKTCGCSVPRPIRIDFFAQVLAVGVPIVADGPPLLVHSWAAGDGAEPPITEPRLIVASDVPGRFTVVWSDSVLRYRNMDRTAVAAEPLGVTRMSSLASHPNPFSGVTSIAYSLSRPGPARLMVVDVRGREVARLVDGVQPRGIALLSWNGRNRTGARVPAGVYFVRLESREAVESLKLVLVK